LTETEWIIGLLAVIAVLLFMCWLALRFIGTEIGPLSARIYKFLYDYEKLNRFEERKKLEAEVAVDRDSAEWQARQPKDGK
jgi:hypothetical protein